MQIILPGMPAYIVDARFFLNVLIEEVLIVEIASEKGIHCGSLLLLEEFGDAFNGIRFHHSSESRHGD